MEKLAGVRVLLLARDDVLAGPLSEGLDRLGWTTMTARVTAGAQACVEDLTVEAVIVVVADAPGLAEAVGVLKAAAEPRRLPVLALGAPPPSDAASAFDLVLPTQAHPRQVAARLETLMRAAISEEEAEVRRATFAARGVVWPEAVEDASPIQVLTVGEPAPKFLALRHALAEGGVEVTGAFTAYTAFDYMHERPFDAVVLWAGETHAEAISIASGMRRNSRLYHVPTVLYVRAGAEIGLDDAYTRGFSDVALADVSPAETAARIQALARERRREIAIRRGLDGARATGLLDPQTGLFTPDLFAAHLAAIARSTRRRRRPLSVAVLRAGDQPRLLRARQEGWLDRAAPQIGSMIGRLVRAEDTAARLGSDVFALALPAARLPAAKAAAARIAAVIACTAFEAGDQPPFTIEFNIGVAEVEPSAPAAQALEHAARQASLAAAA